MGDLNYKNLQIGPRETWDKPIKYSIGEFFAIRDLVVRRHGSYKNLLVRFNPRVLDVGCGSQSGMAAFYEYGYIVYGIDLNENKLTWNGFSNSFFVADVEKSLDEIFTPGTFDIVWCSHTFEHFQNPEETLKKIISVCKPDAYLYFILPYPDLNPAPAHCASKTLGLDQEDSGKTVIKWFTDRGLHLIRKKFDDFREPEIWLEFVLRKPKLPETVVEQIYTNSVLVGSF